MLGKLGVTSRTQALVRAQRLGLVQGGGRLRRQEHRSDRTRTDEGVQRHALRADERTRRRDPLPNVGGG